MLWVPPLFALMKAGEDLCRPPCRICRLPPSRICSADHSRFLTSATTYFLWSQISENGSILFVIGISTNVILSHPRTEYLEKQEPYVHCACATIKMSLSLLSSPPYPLYSIPSSSLPSSSRQCLPQWIAQLFHLAHAGLLPPRQPPPTPNRPLRT